MRLSSTLLWAIVFWISGILSTDFVAVEGTQAGAGVTSDPGHGFDEGSGEVDVLTTTTEGGEADYTVYRVLIVKDTNGQPCLLAALNATMLVSYRVPEGIVHETYLAQANIQLPEDVNAYGICGENSSRLMLDWGNSTFHANFTFTKQVGDGDSNNDTWSLSALSLSYNLSNPEVFPASSEKDVVYLEKNHLNLFRSDVGQTYECEHDITVQLGSSERGVTVSFHDVVLAAFGVTSANFPSDVKYCHVKENEHADEEIVVPLIVATCLSVIVVVVVIAYVITRKIQEAREQSEYKPMP